MSQNAAAADRRTLSIRAGTSRKLLARKAAEGEVDAGAAGEALEDSFPIAGQEDAAAAEPMAALDVQDPAAVETDSTIEEHAPAAAASPAPLPGAKPAQPAPAPAWSAGDERHLQTLLARRKAAGYQRRGRDVSGQLIRPGDIKPNPNTVVAVLVGIVTERGSVGRAELVELMAHASFPHPRAQPSDKGWCQGYVAGAIRNGFLALADAAAPAGEVAISSGDEVSA